jgi:hypothetical protein
MTQASTGTTARVDRLEHSEQPDATGGPRGSTGLRARLGRLLPGEVEPSWQVTTFHPGISRAVVLEFGHEAVDRLGYRDDECVLFLRDLEHGGGLQLRVRGWVASADVARALRSTLHEVWPEVVW